RDPRQPRRVDGDVSRRPVGELEGLSSHFCDGDDAPDQAAPGARTERDDRRRLYDRALLVEPPLAALDLIGVRTLVKPPLAALLELEVLDRVGDEGVAARDAGVGQRLIENPSGWADERLARQILLVARLLADQHQAGMYAPLPRHGLGRKFVERTARTC